MATNVPRGSLKRSVSTKTYRFKRRSGKILHEIMKTLTAIGLCGGLALLMVYLYNFAMCAPCFQLGETVVKGCEKIDKEEVIELAGIVPSMNVLSANLKRMARQIETNPWVKDASVGRELPNRLVIDITEREPIALMRDDVDIFIVDSDGEVFKSFEVCDRVDFPVLVGFWENGRVKESLLKEAVELSRCLRREGRFPSFPDVSEIEGDEIFGLSLYTNNRMVLNLGFGKYDMKLDRLQKILPDLATRVREGSLLRIDLQDYDRVVIAENRAYRHQAFREKKKKNL